MGAFSLIVVINLLNRQVMRKLGIPAVQWTIVVLSIVLSCSASYSDHRCKCECQASPDDENYQRPFKLIRVISSDKCKCADMFGEDWLAEGMSEEALLKGVDYCQNKCECVFETRNTFTIKLIVSLIILVVSLLCLYMIYLLFLDPYVTKRLMDLWPGGIPMDRMMGSRNVDVNASEPELGTSGSSRDARGSARQRQPILDGFHEWKEKVEEQRDTVYNRQAVLS